MVLNWIYLPIQNEFNHYDKQVFIEKNVKNSLQIGFIKLPQGKHKGLADSLHLL